MYILEQEIVFPVIQYRLAIRKLEFYAILHAFAKLHFYMQNEMSILDECFILSY